MTDFSVLIKSAAGEPSRPLDLEAVHAQARRLGWRRLAVFASSLAGLAGLLVPGAAIVAPASRDANAPQRVATGPDSTAADGDALADADAGDADGFAQTAAPNDRGGTARARVPAASPGPDQTTAAAAEKLNGATLGLAPDTTGSSGGEAQEEGCYLVAQDGAQRCEYVATKPAGYRGSGPYELWIERNGQTTYYHGFADADELCEDVGFVQPGDKVIASTGPVESPYEPGAENGVVYPWSGDEMHNPPPPPAANLSVGPTVGCGNRPPKNLPG